MGIAMKKTIVIFILDVSAIYLLNLKIAKLGNIAYNWDKSNEKSG